MNSNLQNDDAEGLVILAGEDGLSRFCLTDAVIKLVIADGTKEDLGKFARGRVARGGACSACILHRCAFGPAWRFKKAWLRLGGGCWLLSGRTNTTGKNWSVIRGGTL